MTSVKTFHEWAEKHCHIDSYLKPGDVIDQGFFDYFRYDMPPRTLEPDLIQHGKLQEFFRNANRSFCGIYATIEKTNGIWHFIGLCFPGERKPALHHIFMRQSFHKSDFNMTFFKNIYTPHEYVRKNGYWYGVTSGRIEGPLRAGIMIHIVDRAGQELSVEKTTYIDTTL